MSTFACESLERQISSLGPRSDVGLDASGLLALTGLRKVAL